MTYRAKTHQICILFGLILLLQRVCETVPISSVMFMVSAMLPSIIFLIIFFCLYNAIFYYPADDIPISPPRINKVSVYPGSRLSATARSCRLRSTLSFKSTWTSPSWWRGTSSTCASTSSSLPATHFAFSSTMTAWFAWARRSTTRPVRPTWWVKQ